MQACGLWVVGCTAGKWNWSVGIIHSFLKAFTFVIMSGKKVLSVGIALKHALVSG